MPLNIPMPLAYEEVDPFPKATLTDEQLDAVPEAISGFSVSLSQVWDEMEPIGEAVPKWVIHSREDEVRYEKYRKRYSELYKVSVNYEQYQRIYNILKNMWNFDEFHTFFGLAVNNVSDVLVQIDKKMDTCGKIRDKFSSKRANHNSDDPRQAGWEAEGELAKAELKILEDFRERVTHPKDGSPRYPRPLTEDDARWFKLELDEYRDFLHQKTKVALKEAYEDSQYQHLPIPEAPKTPKTPEFHDINDLPTFHDTQGRPLPNLRTLVGRGVTHFTSTELPAAPLAKGRRHSLLSNFRRRPAPESSNSLARANFHPLSRRTLL